MIDEELVGLKEISKLYSKSYPTIRNLLNQPGAPEPFYMIIRTRRVYYVAREVREYIDNHLNDKRWELPASEGLICRDEASGLTGVSVGHIWQILKRQGAPKPRLSIISTRQLLYDKGELLAFLKLHKIRKYRKRKKDACKSPGITANKSPGITANDFCKRLINRTIRS